jgi:SMC interacting uncharacterized protein involved in chromosome segregation
MTDLSTITEEQIVVSQDKLTAIRYRVVKEEINLEQLRQEKENLQAQLDIPEPTKEELIEQGKMMHPFYQDNSWVEARITEIDSILGE